MTEFNPYDIETNFHNNDVCSICQENMTEENYYAIPECGHIFHKKCIVNLIKFNCPLCRYPIDVNKIFNINNKPTKLAQASAIKGPVINANG